jgi:hypothetical protein
MADEKDKFQNLGNQAQRVNAAMEFTGGNRDKAVQMAGGGYNDLRVVKIRFAVEKAQIYGGMLMFCSLEQKDLGGLLVVLHGSKDAHDKLRIFDSVKSYYQSLMAIPEKDDATGLFGHIVECFEGFSLFQNVEDKDIEGLTQNMNDIVSKYYEVQGAQCQIDLNDTSSLAMQMRVFLSMCSVPAGAVPLKTLNSLCRLLKKRLTISSAAKLLCRRCGANISMNSRSVSVYGCC